VIAMAEKTEEQKVAEFKQQLEEHEKEEAAAKAKIAKKFDPKALAESTKEIRVQTGRLGFKREFEKADDPLLSKIWIFAGSNVTSE
jgi:urease accessory protein UreH